MTTFEAPLVDERLFDCDAEIAAVEDVIARLDALAAYVGDGALDDEEAKTVRDATYFLDNYIGVVKERQDADGNS